MPAEGELVRLVDEARHGDQDAWNVLVDRFTPLVWAVARGHGLPLKAAADVTHTSWLRLLESLDAAPGDALGEWVTAIARAESLQALRWVDPRPDRRQQQVDPLWAAVELLPARCRLVLRLLAVAPPATMHEIAAALDVSSDAAHALADECLDRLAATVAGTRSA